MNDIKVSIAIDFSLTPGSRYESEGEFSGEEFRKKILREKYKEALEKNKKLIVNLDGTYGYGTSFLEEVFGGLAREFKKDDILDRLIFISNEEPYLIDDIKKYIREA